MASKDIKVLSDAEHILRRPEMYVGQTNPSEEKIPIYDDKDGRIKFQDREISIGMYKILNEVIDNSYDEAKRQGGKMTKIAVHIDTKTNIVTVEDDGGGFKNAHLKHKETNLSNMETAVSVLRAGSNFETDDTEESLIGMHGVGVSCTNVLSDYFKIETKEHGSRKTVVQEWKKFKPVGKLQTSKKNKSEHGTKISFRPRTTVFGNLEWDIEYIRTILILKKYVVKTDSSIRNLDLSFTVDGEKISIHQNIFPEESIIIRTSMGLVAAMPMYSGGNDISFVNSAECTGIHQTIFKQYIAKLHKYQYAYRHLHLFMILNLPPVKVKFAGQNKSRLATSRDDIESDILDSFGKEFRRKYKGSELFEEVEESINQEKNQKQLKQIKKKKRSITRIKLSEKYLPPSSMRGATDLLIAEGLSAKGGLAQKRDSQSQGIYTLKGKPKNVRDIKNLKNEEFIELMNILRIDPTKPEENTVFSRVIIASDADEDGLHIQGLLINFFFRYFPKLIESGKLFILTPPIGICTYKKKKKYFYRLNEFEDFVENNPISDFKYAKGLGSYSVQDWDYIMKNMNLQKITVDEHASNAINLAFGPEASYRKEWLMNKIEISDVPKIDKII